METLFTTSSLIAFITLCILELVLGIDNIIFISIAADQLPVHQQKRARATGLLLAVIARIGLLFALSWVITLTSPLLLLYSHPLSGRDLLLIGGGAFLVVKSGYEIYSKLAKKERSRKSGRAKFTLVLIEILLLDIVFSLDSVITAIGMVSELFIIISAILIATAIMLLASDVIARFVETHANIKMLALSFLVLVGSFLFVEGLGYHPSKIPIYFALGFSLLVELLNSRFRV